MTDKDDLHQSMAELRRLVQENSGLVKSHQTWLSRIETHVAQTNRDISSQVNHLAQGQRDLATKIGKVHSDLTDLIRDNRRDMTKLIAYGQLADVQRQIDVRFGPYKKVRDNVRGVLAHMDHGLVQETTLQAIAEFRVVDAPDYWLASMLNATVAWIRRERPATEKALRHAARLDRARSALYAALLSARYGRFETADHWLHAYLSEQNPLELTDDFVVLLDATVSGALGGPARIQITERCHSWYEQLSTGSAMADQQVDRWRKVLAAHTPDAPDPTAWQDWPALTAVRAPWHGITDQLRLAGAFERLHATLQRRSAEGGGADPAADTTDQVARVDRMLGKLADLPEPEERRLRLRERNLHRLVGHDSDGREPAPEERLSENPEETHVDFLTLLSNLSAQPNPFPQARQPTVRLATWLCRGWAVRAVQESADRISAAVDQGLPAAIGPWKGRILPESTEDGLVTDLSADFDQDLRQEVERERLAVWWISSGAIAAFGVLYWIYAVTTGWRFGSAPALSVLALSATAAALATGLRLTAPGRVQAAQDRGAAAKKEAIRTVRAALAEYQQLRKECGLRLQPAQQLTDFLRNLPEPRIVEVGHLDGDHDAIAGRRQSTQLLPRWDLRLEES
jgi:hypothetical protein